MPTYEYRCKACGHEFEEFQPISAKPIRKCPKCGKSAVNRLISAGAGIIFRGSGFYETDYRSDNYKAGARKDSDTTTTKPAADAKPASGEKAASSDAPSKTPTAAPAAEAPVAPAAPAQTANPTAARASSKNSGRGSKK